uniref:Putative nucleus n=1 Tax=Rhipicephalus pulchellus TaxID=72859 RepID=L7LVZ2_RHIPC
MDDASSPCPVPSNKHSAGSEYATLTPVAPMSYTAVPQMHQHVEQSATLYPHHQQPVAAATVAVFPTFFCGGTVPEMTSTTTSSIELQDLPTAVAGVPSPDFSVNSDSDDSSSDKGGSTDPFAPECKIPLPVPYSPYDYWLEPTFIRRRNERERQRVRHVNDGFERLRTRLPLPPRDKDRRLSKVETLRYAISYIRHLQRLLGLIDDDDDDEDGENSRCHR